MYAENFVCVVPDEQRGKVAYVGVVDIRLLRIVRKLVVTREVSTAADN
jgi:hypothetical protein